MRPVKLTKSERAIEQALLRGEYVEATAASFKEIGEAVARRRKDAMISIRINSQDLKQIKTKAKRLGVRYQTFISEVLHRVAA